jgi:hypothetical protein
MSSQISAKPAVDLNEQNRPPKVAQQDDKVRLMDRMRIWIQVCLAELLNLLERRRYDLKR